MTLRTYIPPPPLSEFVDLMWLCEDYRLGHARERILPDGSMALIFNLREDRLRLYDPEDPSRFQTVGGSLVCGPRSTFHVIDTACQEFMIGLHFKPGGAFPFFGLPANELRESCAQLEQVWNNGATEIRDQLLEVFVPAEKFKIIERALIARLKSQPARHPAIAFALREFQRPRFSRRLSEVTDQIGLSHRRFIQLFTQEVGLTPKLFCRIRRFHDVVRILATIQDVDWANVALGCGYYDQAHFIHDFRAFSGLSPTDYLTQRGEHLNHVPLRN